MTPQMSVLPSRPLAVKTSGGCQPVFDKFGRVATFDRRQERVVGGLCVLRAQVARSRRE